MKYNGVGEMKGNFIIYYFVECGFVIGCGVIGNNVDIFLYGIVM